MTLILGTNDGVWQVTDGRYERIALDGKYVSHVATSGSRILAAVPHDGLYDVPDAGEARIWEGDARSCAISPEGKLYVGIEPAMIYRSDDNGTNWVRLDGIDELPTRKEWYFPPPPHQPHVRSIDFLPGVPESILAGIEVGGVLLSEDYGETWREMNEGLHVDVHTVRPDPSHHGSMMAVTGGGIYASEDGGASWEPRMNGTSQGYAVGLHINPHRSGEALVATGERPPGLNSHIFHSVDAGRSWKEVRHALLPERYSRVPVLLFADAAVWIATEEGQIFRADDVEGDWSLVCRLPAEVNAAAGGGSPSSISAGHRA